MFRGTDNLNTFFAIGIGTETVSAPAGTSQFVQTAKAEKENLYSAFSGSLETASGPTVNTGTGSPSAQVNSTPSPETNPTPTVETAVTKPGMIGGGSVPVVVEEEMMVAKTGETPKFKMTTKHWVILAVVVVGLYLAYKHFTKKQA